MPCRYCGRTEGACDWYNASYCNSYTGPIVQFVFRARPNRPPYHSYHSTDTLAYLFPDDIKQRINDWNADPGEYYYYHLGPIIRRGET